MVEGWARQQRSRLLREETIGQRLGVVRRFAGFTNEYPWRWEPKDVEDFTSFLRSGSRARARSTIRGYQTSLGLFCSYLVDPAYGWAVVCEQRFDPGGEERTCDAEWESAGTCGN